MASDNNINIDMNLNKQILGPEELFADLDIPEVRPMAAYGDNYEPCEA